MTDYGRFTGRSFAWVLGSLLFAGVSGISGVWADDLPSLPGPVTPPALDGAKHPVQVGTDRWTIAPTISYYIPEGTGDAALFNDALGVGAELSYRPGKIPGPFRFVVSFSYLQMTPGPSLVTELSSGSLFSSNTTPSTSGPIPGSASITGFVVTVGGAYDFASLLPDSWTGWGTLSPYVRGDIGMNSLAASGSGPLNGHPYGMVFDAGGGISWHVPGLPMGVFAELDPTGMVISNEFLFLTPLVSGITIWF